MALREDIEKQGNWLFRWRSYLPLLLIPVLLIGLRDSRILERIFGDSISDFWEACAIVISFTGLLVRCLTAGYVPRGTSGRNTKWQAAETMNTTGMYSVVRNPLYLGNFIIVFGIVLFIQVWWIALLVSAGFFVYYERIIFAEEEFLRKKFGIQFTEWAEKTPAIIPNFKNWKKPALSFSFKTVLRREFSTMFSIIAVFFFLEVATNFIINKHFSARSSWIAFFITGLIFYFIVLVLKKKTRLINVNGR
ncbi:MAG: isoprenylcysteine carboxylmethyltransferase family protein [Candidatus Omnitrophica bacterium]|nr:isoprenylcysteine carboxylmethyltransferase family protein [Candidatus Omnitrophota bacterium]